MDKIQPAPLVAAAGCVATGVPAVAGAPVIQNDHFVSTQDSHLEQEEHADFCPEVTFPVLWEGRVSANFQIRTRGLDGPEYYAAFVIDPDGYCIEAVVGSRRVSTSQCV